LNNYYFCKLKNVKNGFLQDSHLLILMIMKDRIAHIIRAKNLTATEFAERLGIQPSGVSHLLSGRNNPSLDFVKRLKETFPEYNLDWIIFGKGPMTGSEFASIPPPAPSSSDSQKAQETMLQFDEVIEEPVADVVPDFVEPQHKQDSKPSSGKLKSIVLVYDDNTFEVLDPK